MNELYWLTRLDGITFLLIAGLICTIILVVVGFIWFCAASDEDETSEVASAKKLLKRSTVWLIIFAILKVLIPTTKEAAVIMGVGGTLDYLQNDSIAREIPHKVIKACDIYLEDIINKE